MLGFFDKLTDVIDKGHVAIAVFLDFSKAFNVVNHEILLCKLLSYGVRPNALSWFKTYLSHRKHYVCYGEANSDTRGNNSGVTQGSVLGSLLFLLFVNDRINSSTLLHFILFADDANLLASHKDHLVLNDIINNELNKLYD